MGNCLTTAVIAIMLIVYLYTVFASGKVCEGRVKNAIYLFVVSLLVTVSAPFGLLPLGMAAVVLTSFLFLYFYSELLPREFWKQILLPGTYLTAGTWWQSQGISWTLKMGGISGNGLASCTGILVLVGMLFLTFVLLSYVRGYLRAVNFVMVALVYGAVSAGAVMTGMQTAGLGTVSDVIYIFLPILSVLIFLLLEINLRYYESGYRKTTKALQEEIMQRQFGEIKDIYLNMRGWRHDYHNHIQVLKAQLDGGQSGEARKYLNQIEHELDKVDTFVKSGNMMVDAVLNSKLTLAMQRKIKVTCEAYLPAELFLPDADVCTLLGNVLDNAIEGCEKVPEDRRFLRIYMAMVKEQLYLSVQNASMEGKNPDQKEYVTTKRGNHGLGLKRVAAVVERFGGFLHLSSEEGVFGTEVTIPKP